MAMPRLADLVNKMNFQGVWQPVQSKLQVFQNLFRFRHKNRTLFY